MAEQDGAHLPAVTPDCHTVLTDSEDCGSNAQGLSLNTPSDVKEGERHSTHVIHVTASDEHKHEESGVAPSTAHSAGSASSSSSKNATTQEDNAEKSEQAAIKNGETAGEAMDPPAEAVSPSENASLPGEEHSSTSARADDESRGDHNRLTRRNEQVAKKGEPEVGEQGGAKTTTPAAQTDAEGDHQDGPKPRLDSKTPEVNSTDAEAGEDDGSNADTAKSSSSPRRVLPQETSHEEKLNKETKPVETIGPSTPDAADGTAPVIPRSGGGSGRHLVLVVIGVVLAVLAHFLLQRVLKSEPQRNVTPQIDIFLRQMETLETRFPKQRADLWKRSRIHLLRHLKTAQPTEPVSLILTAGVRAERTLQCLAQDLASAFSTSLNASVLHIDGASRASQDSDQVKLDIDSKLRGAFEGDQPVAVIHRFEELPPGSTLIFYRYCDHENAAYKRTFLIFTVLLGEEEEIPAQSRLSDVEEMVDDHLQKKFLSDDQPVAFDKMDLDKYGGLWSRISHLILPVTAEGTIERYGC